MDGSLILTAVVGTSTVPPVRGLLVPWTPQEIVKEAVQCFRMGATVVHILAHDEAETRVVPGARDLSNSMPLYRLLIGQIRQQFPDAIISVPTDPGYSDDDSLNRTGALLVGADMATVQVGPAPLKGESLMGCNPPWLVHEITASARNHDVIPAFEIYTDKDFDVAVEESQYNAKKISEMAWVVFQDIFFDEPGLTPQDDITGPITEWLKHANRRLPSHFRKGVIAATRPDFYFPVLDVALKEGWDVRVGSEDCYFDSRGNTCSSARAVEVAAERARYWSRDLITPENFRGALK